MLYSRYVDFSSRLVNVTVYIMQCYCIALDHHVVAMVRDFLFESIYLYLLSMIGSFIE